MNKDRPDDPKDAARKAREERLAAALRANLRRRKAATRSGAESGESPPPKSPGEAGADDE